MKKYLMILLAGAMQASCNTATGVSELYAVQGEWQLTVIERNDGTTAQIPIPARYTIEFNGEGSWNAQADCNGCSGAYVTDGNALSLGPVFACTAAACGPLSLFNEYTAALGSVSSFVRSGAQLRLGYAEGELVYLVND